MNAVLDTGALLRLASVNRSAPKYPRTPCGKCMRPPPRPPLRLPPHNLPLDPTLVFFIRSHAPAIGIVAHLPYPLPICGLRPRCHFTRIRKSRTHCSRPRHMLLTLALFRSFTPASHRFTHTCRYVGRTKLPCSFVCFVRADSSLSKAAISTLSLETCRSPGHSSARPSRGGAR